VLAQVVQGLAHPASAIQGSAARQAHSSAMNPLTVRGIAMEGQESNSQSVTLHIYAPRLDLTRILVLKNPLD
jgi:hypothetical protein